MATNAVNQGSHIGLGEDNPIRPNRFIHQAKLNGKSDYVPLFDPSKNHSKCAYLTYGVALTLAIATVALGVFTYYGYRPLAPLLQKHTVRQAVAGALMGVGSVGILAIIFRYFWSAGSLDRQIAKGKKQLEQAISQAKKAQSQPVSAQQANGGVSKSAQQVQLEKTEDARLKAALAVEISEMHRSGILPRNESTRVGKQAGQAAVDVKEAEPPVSPFISEDDLEKESQAHQQEELNDAESDSEYF